MGIEFSSKLILKVGAGPFWHHGLSLGQVNFNILIALTPAVFMAVSRYEAAALQVMGVSVLTCVLTEGAWHKIIKAPQRLGDLSAVITGMFLAFLLPAGINPAVAAAGALGGLVLGKLIFGGPGSNPVPPALVGWLLISLLWPRQLDAEAIMLESVLNDPLMTLKFFGPEAVQRFSMNDLLLGRQLGGLGSAQIMGLLIGGTYLLLRGLLKIYPPLGFIGGIVCASLFLKYSGLAPQPPVWFHILSGSAVFSMFFLMIGPSVLSPRSLSLAVYGFLGGGLTVFIRAYGSHPDGAPCAVIFAGLTVFLFNRFQSKKPFGAVN